LALNPRAARQGNGLGAGQLGPAKDENAAPGLEKRPQLGQGEAHRPHRHGLAWFSRVILASLAPNLDIGEAHFSCRFSQKRPAFGAGLEESERQIRAKGGEDKSGRTVPGPDIDNPPPQEVFAAEHRSDECVKRGISRFGAREVYLP
jgi:hypothetical protein